MAPGGRAAQLAAQPSSLRIYENIRAQSLGICDILHVLSVNPLNVYNYGFLFIFHDDGSG